MQIPQIPDNSLTDIIGQLLKECQRLAHTYGDSAFHFAEPLNESAFEEWETMHDVQIPQSYKDWLRFSGEGHILYHMPQFLHPTRFYQDSELPDDFVIIGKINSGGHTEIAFSKEMGQILIVDDERGDQFFDTFGELLTKIVLPYLKKC